MAPRPRSSTRTASPTAAIEVLEHATYHPASRFWLFQAIEASIFVAMALALLAFSVIWIRRRVG